MKRDTIYKRRKQRVKTLLVITTLGGACILGYYTARYYTQKMIAQIEQEAIERYINEQEQTEEHSHQYQVELLEPVQPVNQYYLAQEGTLI